MHRERFRSTQIRLALHQGYRPTSVHPETVSGTFVCRYPNRLEAKRRDPGVLQTDTILQTPLF
jgi:hypothetical protein